MKIKNDDEMMNTHEKMGDLLETQADAKLRYEGQTETIETTRSLYLNEYSEMYDEIAEYLGAASARGDLLIATIGIETALDEVASGVYSDKARTILSNTLMVLRAGEGELSNETTG